MAKRRKPKGLPRGVFTRLSQMSKAALARRRLTAHTEMAEALIAAGVLEWGTELALPETAEGLKKAKHQAARMSLEGWSKRLGKSWRDKRFTLHKNKWYRVKPDGKRGASVRRLGPRKMRKRDGVLVDVNAPGGRVDRSIAQSAYAARIRIIQKIMGSTYAEARKSYRREGGEWDKMLQDPEEESPGLAARDDEAIPLPLEAQIALAGFREAERRIYQRVKSRIEREAERA